MSTTTKSKDAEEVQHQLQRDNVDSIDDDDDKEEEEENQSEEEEGGVLSRLYRAGGLRRVFRRQHATNEQADGDFCGDGGEDDDDDDDDVASGAEKQPHELENDDEEDESDDGIPPMFILPGEYFSDESPQGRSPNSRRFNGFSSSSPGSPPGSSAYYDFNTRLGLSRNDDAASSHHVPRSLPLRPPPFSDCAVGFTWADEIDIPATASSSSAADGEQKEQVGSENDGEEGCCGAAGAAGGLGGGDIRAPPQVPSSSARVAAEIPAGSSDGHGGEMTSSGCCYDDCEASHTPPPRRSPATPTATNAAPSCHSLRRRHPHIQQQRRSQATAKDDSGREEDGVGVLDVVLAKRQMSHAAMGQGDMEHTESMTTEETTETEDDGEDKGDFCAESSPGGRKGTRRAVSTRRHPSSKDETRVGAYFVSQPRSGTRPGGQGDPSTSSERVDEVYCGLPVATTIAVDGIRVTGIQHDVDSKPAQLKERTRFRLYAFFCVLTTIAVVIGVACVMTLEEKEANDAASMTNSSWSAPARMTHSEFLGIEELIETALARVGGSLRDDSNANNPYAKALEWIIYDDPMQLTAESPNLIQRYTAAYFYYATSVDGPWLSCNPDGNPGAEDARRSEMGNSSTKAETTICYTSRVPFNNEKSYSAYRKMKLRPTDFPKVESLTHKWLSNITECMWAGVHCDSNEQIRFLELVDLGLSGRFPEGIYNLHFLEHLALVSGKLRGPLPVDLLKKLPHLSAIILPENAFTGPVPNGWWEQMGGRRLIRMSLSGNSITGSIPTEIGIMHSLKFLELGDNQLTGTIPTQVGLLSSLAVLDLSFNAIEGRLPSWLGNMKALRNLYLNNIQVHGTIPQEIGNLAALGTLELDNNWRLTGTIPDGIWKLPSLSLLKLSSCDLTGTLNLVDAGPYLKQVDLAHNRLRGKLPPQLAALGAFVTLRLEGNEFTGTVPQEICNNVQDGHEFVADCAPSEFDGRIELICQCCSSCCQPDGKKCMLPYSGA